MKKINKYDFNYFWKLIHIGCFIIIFIFAFSKCFASVWGLGHPVDIHVRTGEEIYMEEQAKEKEREKEAKKEEEKQKKEDEKKKKEDKKKK